MSRKIIVLFVLLFSALAHAEGRTADKLVCKVVGPSKSKVVKAELVFDHQATGTWSLGQTGVLELFTDNRDSEFYGGDYIFREVPVMRLSETGMSWIGEGLSFTLGEWGQDGAPVAYAKLTGPWFSGVRGTPTLRCEAATVILLPAVRIAP